MIFLFIFGVSMLVFRSLCLSVCMTVYIYSFMYNLSVCHCKLIFFPWQNATLENRVNVTLSELISSHLLFIGFKETNKCKNSDPVQNH